MSKIRVFLDVDSTILMPKSPLINNCDSGTTVMIPHTNKDGRVFFREEDLRWNSKVISFFSNLENVEIWWLTGWKANASLILDPLFNITSAGWVNWSFGDLPNEEGKIVSLLEHQAGNSSPFIWLDDTANLNSAEVLSSLDTAGEHLVVAPNPDFGLRDFELEVISQFIQNHN